MEQWIRGGLAFWLGVALPLLCVPGMSSLHTHGIHWVWEQGSVEPQTDGHTHDHDHSHSHAHPTNRPAPLPQSGQPRLSTAQTVEFELLVNLFALMHVAPAAPPLAHREGWALPVVGAPMTLRSLPPDAPWNPPKSAAFL